MESPIRVRCASVLLVADDECCESAVVALERTVDCQWARITVASVPRTGGFITAYAPLTGATTPERIEQEADYRANDTARILACKLDVSGLSYLVVRDWRRLAAMIDGGSHDVVVLGRLPRRRRDLRRLVQVSARTGTALVFGRREPASAS